MIDCSRFSQFEFQNWTMFKIIGKKCIGFSFNCFMTVTLVTPNLGQKLMSGAPQEMSEEGHHTIHRLL